MNIIDNFDIITEFFIKENMQKYLDDNNAFLCISVISRYKDLDFTPDVKEHQMVYHTYIITDISQIQEYKSEIIRICNGIKNVRAYISTSPRSLYKFNGKLLNVVSNYITDGTYVNDIISKYEVLVDTAAKQTLITTDENFRNYLIDIDTHVDDNQLLQICHIIIKCGGKVKLSYNTYHGIHIVTSVYDSKKFFKDVNSIINTDFIEQKGTGCRMLLYGNINNI